MVEDDARRLLEALKERFGYFGLAIHKGKTRLIEFGRVLRVRQVKRIWFNALRRRSQKARLRWERFSQLLAVFPLPKPVIHRSWHGPSA